MIIALLLLLALFALGIPIALALGIAPVWAIWDRGISLVILPQIIFESLDSFALMAIPFFVLAGKLMQAGGIATRLINLAVALLGWMRGGLASASVLTSMIFATMSGSSSATAAAIGTTLIPSMERNRYPYPFAAATVAASAELGAIIPPSVPMIVYAVVANVSIADLFLAGVIPGLLIGFSLIGYVTVISWWKNYGTVSQVAFTDWLRGVGTALRQATLSLVMPLIVLGGIYGGLFTPTEAAVVAVAYALVLGVFIYKEVRLRELPELFFSAALTSSIVLVIVAFASVFAYALSIYQLPQTVAAGIRSISDDPVVFLLVVNILLLVVGMFIETLAAIVIIAPILVPVAMSLGIDPIHFGAVIIVNLATGMVTPPVGVNLFIVSHIAGIKMEAMIRPLLGFLAVIIINLMVISYVPALTTFLIR
ncbi:TRAP transporter large permease [Nordella sp. HKS 07]|uniref:TRAP transporter large permease n=1 Tax=Nordella sp. HKS 07 TaxID=2712222 RepID=UPI0013E1980D|nr:TRAP transporter large permease [Nordella sp. HKS 07]QIG48426.1 TRAP transporter large permease [Nordella sp. HKS 07]